jgi:hypothetical protein
MSILCEMFGHRPDQGYYKHDGWGYFDVREGATDGIGRIHGDLYCECARCGVRYQVGKLHIPQVVANEYGPAKPVKEVLAKYEQEIVDLKR